MSTNTTESPITVTVDYDPRGVSVGVWQGSHCIYSGAHPLPAAPGASTVEEKANPNGQNVGQIVDDYIQEYELRGEDEEGRDGVYRPNETERYMIADAIYGLLAEPEFIAAIAGMHNAPAAGDALDAVDWYERRRELESGMIFRTASGVVQLDRPVPGDGTKWYVLAWNGDGWSAYDDTVEPVDLIGAPVANHPIAIELARAAIAAQRKGDAL